MEARLHYFGGKFPLFPFSVERCTLEPLPRRGVFSPRPEKQELCRDWCISTDSGRRKKVSVKNLEPRRERKKLFFEYVKIGVFSEIHCQVVVCQECSICRKGKNLPWVVGCTQTKTETTISNGLSSNQNQCYYFLWDVHRNDYLDIVYIYPPHIYHY